MRLRTRVGVLMMVTGLLAAPAALADGGDASVMTGTWQGPSYDTTYGIPGDLTATFAQRTATTFDGTIEAVYPPEFGSETCAIKSGTVSSDGSVDMVAICRAEGYPAPEAATIMGQLDASGTTLTGTFKGPAHDVGTFTLTKTG